jgi:WD40 repeat protein
MRSLSLFVALVLFVLESPSFAEPQTESKPKLDVYGDPLPDSALMRLGTTRFRVGGLVYACAYSPDGKTIAVGSTDARLRLFDAATGRRLRELKGHKDDVTCLAYSPNGQILASGSLKGTICLHETASGKMIRRFGGKEDRVWGLAFTPDGKKLVSGGGSQNWENKDYPVRIWDVNTGKQLQTLLGHKQGIRTLAVSPDGKWLASAAKTTFDKNEDGHIRLWDLASGKLVRILKGQKYGMYSLAFSPDSKLLASGSHDGTVWLWELASGKDVRRLEIAGGSVLSLAISPDGKILAAGGDRQSLHLWELNTGKVLYHLPREGNPYKINWHEGGIPCLAFAPDGQTLVYGEDAALKRLDTRSGKSRDLRMSNGAAVGQMRFLDAKTLTTFADNGQLLRWDVRESIATPLMSGKKRFSSADRTALSPDQHILAVWDGPDLQLWNTTTGEKHRDIPMFDKSNNGYLIGRVVYSPDGKRVAATIPNRALVCLWDAATGKKMASLEKFPGGPDRADLNLNFSCLCFSPDSRFLASPSPAEHTIWLHNVQSGKFLRELKAGESRVGYALCFSADGRMLASASSDGEIFLWEMRTGGLRLCLKGHDQTPHNLAFAGNNRWLASISGDQTIRLWDVLTGKQIRSWQGHDGSAACLAFSPDDRILATGGYDTTVLLWDINHLLSKYTWKEEILDDAKQKALWSDLSDQNADRAYQALSRLVLSYRPVAFLKNHLKPARAADDPTVARLLRDLDDDSFEAREKATADLLKMGEPIEASLRRALSDRPSLEVRRRIENLQAKLRREILRATRAVEVLEQIGDAEAQALLSELAQGVSDSPLTQEAKASLQRLKRRK